MREKYSGILLCSDLDGTLLNSAGQISAENARAIREFREQGGTFCLATGRLPRYLLQYGDKIDLDGPVICCNGACIYDFASERLLYAQPLGSKVADLTVYLQNRLAHVERIAIFDGLERVSFENFTQDWPEIVRILTEREVYKAVLCMDVERNAVALKQELTSQFGTDFNFSRSWDTGLEILNVDATKGETVPRLCRMLGGIEKVICVGDYENDITMLQTADIGCAVSNAVDALKAVADRVICSNDGHAIRYIVDTLFDL